MVHILGRRDIALTISIVILLITSIAIILTVLVVLSRRSWRVHAARAPTRSSCSRTGVGSVRVSTIVRHRAGRKT